MQHERLIGRAIILWSRLEAQMQSVIWEFYGLPLEYGRIITESLDAKYKLMMLRKLTESYVSDDNIKDELNTLYNNIQFIYDERNIIAHGLWGTLTPDAVPAVMSLKPKDEKLPRDEIMTETFPAWRMYSVVDRCILATNALLGSCPIGWCNSSLVTAFSGKSGRDYQAATADSMMF
jgi:hypothetical protein